MTQLIRFIHILSPFKDMDPRVIVRKILSVKGTFVIAPQKRDRWVLPRYEEHIARTCTRVAAQRNRELGTRRYSVRNTFAARRGLTRSTAIPIGLDAPLASAMCLAYYRHAWPMLYLRGANLVALFPLSLTTPRRRLILPRISHLRPPHLSLPPCRSITVQR